MKGEAFSEERETDPGAGDRGPFKHKTPHKFDFPGEIPAETEVSTRSHRGRTHSRICWLRSVRVAGVGSSSASCWTSPDSDLQHVTGSHCACAHAMTCKTTCLPLHRPIYVLKCLFPSVTCLELTEYVCATPVLTHMQSLHAHTHTHTIRLGRHFEDDGDELFHFRFERQRRRRPI